jgi:hypothetical protein
VELSIELTVAYYCSGSLLRARAPVSSRRAAHQMLTIEQSEGAKYVSRQHDATERATLPGAEERGPKVRINARLPLP